MNKCIWILTLFIAVNSSSTAQVGLPLQHSLDCTEPYLPTPYTPKMRTITEKDSSIFECLHLPCWIRIETAKRTEVFIYVGGDRKKYISYHFNGIQLTKSDAYINSETGIVDWANQYPIAPLPSTTILGKLDFDASPYTQVPDIVATLPSVFQQQRGADLNIRGAGQYGTLYVVDGMKIMR